MSTPHKPNTPEEQANILAALAAGLPIEHTSLSNPSDVPESHQGWADVDGTYSPSFENLRYRIKRHTTAERHALINAQADPKNTFQYWNESRHNWGDLTICCDFLFYFHRYRIKPVPPTPRTFWILKDLESDWKCIYNHRYDVPNNLVKNKSMELIEVIEKL